MSQSSKKPVALAVGTALVGGLMLSEIGRGHV